MAHANLTSFCYVFFATFFAPLFFNYFLLFHLPVSSFPGLYGRQPVLSDAPAGLTELLARCHTLWKALQRARLDFVVARI